MKSVVSVLLVLLAAVAQAISSGGERLLVILDDVADKTGYSKFLGDLESILPPFYPGRMQVRCKMELLTLNSP